MAIAQMLCFLEYAAKQQKILKRCRRQLPQERLHSRPCTRGQVTLTQRSEPTNNLPWLLQSHGRLSMHLSRRRMRCTNITLTPPRQRFFAGWQFIPVIFPHAMSWFLRGVKSPRIKLPVCLLQRQILITYRSEE